MPFLRPCEFRKLVACVLRIVDLDNGRRAFTLSWFLIVLLPSSLTALIFGPDAPYLQLKASNRLKPFRHRV